MLLGTLNLCLEIPHGERNNEYFNVTVENKL